MRSQRECLSLLLDFGQKIFNLIRKKSVFLLAKFGRMLFKKVFSVMVLVSLYIEDCACADHSTCLSRDYHVNRSSLGSSSCKPAWDGEHKIIVKCGLKTTADIRRLISRPGIVHDLDASHNLLSKIEDDGFCRFSGLINLDLSHNRIENIQRGAFNGLTKLQILDLSFNNIVTWYTVDIARQMPSITEITITSNPSWNPVGQHFANLPNITFIRGIIPYLSTYSGRCVNCDLKKHENSGQNSNSAYLAYGCYTVNFSLSEQFVTFRSLNFSLRCKVVKSKFCSYFGGSRNRSRTYTVDMNDVCLPGINDWAILNISLGFVTVILNVVVMTTVFWSHSLRKNVNMYFIANMTIGDFLQGIWLLVLSITRLVTPSFEFDILKRTRFCVFVFLLFLTSQTLSAGVAFLVTVERYFCVVYSTRPNIRITKRIAQKLMMFLLVVLIIIDSLPFALHMKPGRDYSCLNFAISARNTRLYLEYIGALGVFLYILCYCLYGRIFHVVRVSSLNVGVQREGKIAKRIIFVISTNLFFFLGPMIAGQLLYIFDLLGHRESFIFWNAVSLSFLGVNSCLNPVFYAFCNRRFRNELKKHLKCRKNVIGIGTR